MNEGAIDSALIERFRKRDPQVVEALYDRFSTLVFSLFFRITRDRNVAEDLVQELFIRVWNRAAEFDANRGSLGVWILSVARHMGIDYMRSAHARFLNKLQSMDSAGEIAREEREQDELIDEVRTVAEAFRVLNANQKRVLELAYFEGMSQKEIADRLGEPLGTVKSWTRSGLQSLRSAMDPARKPEGAH